MIAHYTVGHEDVGHEEVRKTTLLASKFCIPTRDRRKRGHSPSAMKQQYTVGNEDEEVGNNTQRGNDEVGNNTLSAMKTKRSATIHSGQ